MVREEAQIEGRIVIKFFGPFNLCNMYKTLWLGGKSEDLYV